MTSMHTRLSRGLHARHLLSLGVAVLSVITAHTVRGGVCPTACEPAPLTVCPIPTLRVHVDFPVVYRATHNWQGCGRILTWRDPVAPPEFGIDGAGGLFFWTPDVASLGEETITVSVETVFFDPPFEIDEETFVAVVDDNTMTYPVWRDYRDEENEVVIMGRATGTPGGDRSASGVFESYTIEYGELFSVDPEAQPAVWVPIMENVRKEQVETAALGTWDISALADGGRYALRLTVHLTADGKDPPPDPDVSVVSNQVVIDRTAIAGWPQRLEAITHSPGIGDIDDDGQYELFVVSRSGTDLMKAWDIDGTLLWQAGLGGSVYSSVSTGDITGDGVPEVLWTSDGSCGNSRLQACTAVGTVVPGFPIMGPADRVFRSTPTLADITGDGVLDVLVASTGSNCPVGGTDTSLVVAYTYASGNPEPIFDPPLQTRPGFNFIYASVSVADLDPTPGIEPIIVTAASPSGSTGITTRAFAWGGDGEPYAPAWAGGIELDVAITGTQATGGGGANSSAQPAIVDLREDDDGDVEIIIGPNVLSVDGTKLFTLPGATPSLSAAVGEIDDASPGLEIVIGHRVYSATGALLTTMPFSMHTSILSGMGEAGTMVAGSPRSSTPLPGVLAYDAQGNAVEGFPKSLYGNTEDDAAPVVADLDGDGLVDMATAITDGSYGGVLAVWTSACTNEDERHEWPMLGHDPQHSGFYTVPRPNRPSCVVAASGGGGRSISWTDRSGVEDEYIVERSETGDAWSFLEIVSLPAGATAYADAGGVSASRYRVRAARTDPTSGRRVVSAFGAPVIVGGDLDEDGQVGFADLLGLLTGWGPCPEPCPPSCAGDLDGGCAIGFSDLLMLLTNWGIAGGSCAD